MRNSTLFFSPFSAVQKHGEVELLLAMNMDKGVDSPVFLTCKGLFGSFCVAMSASGYTEGSTKLELSSVCRTCSNIGSMTNPLFGFSNIFVEDYLKGFSRHDCASILKNLSSTEWIGFVYRGVPVGKFASYEFFLNHKLSTIEIPAHLWGAFINHLENCILAVEIGFNYFKENTHEKVLVYNRLYSINRIFCHVAELHGVKTFSLQGAGPIRNPYSRISAFRDDADIFKQGRSSAWVAYSQTRLRAIDVWRATSHLKNLLRARSPWVYSTPGGKASKSQLISRLGITEKQNIFLLTTSSQDELLAASLTGVYTPTAEKLLFRNSMEWIEFVANEVKNQPNWFLIIRPHPREFPNKREGVKSDSGEKLTTFLKKFESSSNIFINHPDQNLSIYDLAKITSVHLNSTSTVGLEMTLLGVPCLVISKSNLTAYPPEINYEATNKSEYLALMTSLRREIPKEFSMNAIRWISFRYFKSTIRYRFSYNVMIYALANSLRRLEKQVKSSSLLIEFIRAVFKLLIYFGSGFRFNQITFQSPETTRISNGERNSRESQNLLLALFRIISWKFR